MNMLLWFWFFFLMNNVMHSPFSAVICSSFATKVDCWNTCLYCTWSSTEKRIWWQGTSSITFLIYLERCVFGSWVYLHDSALKFHKHAVLMALLLLMFLLCMCAVRPCLVVRSFHLWFVISSVTVWLTPIWGKLLLADGFVYDKQIADVWSCGVTLYVMVVGAYPFEDPEEPKNFRKTIQVTLIHFSCFSYIFFLYTSWVCASKCLN